MTTGQLCVRAVTAGCTAFESGSAIAGLSADIINSSTSDIVASGTTDADGKFCATVDLGKTYDLKVTSGSCVPARRVYLPGSCEAAPTPAAYDVIVCCAVVCVDVSATSRTTPTTPIPRPLEDAAVTDARRNDAGHERISTGRIACMTTDQIGRDAGTVRGWGLCHAVAAGP
jgi:hypothetical protein